VLVVERLTVVDEHNGDIARSEPIDEQAEFVGGRSGPGELTVLLPESRGGIRAERYDEYVSSSASLVAQNMPRPAVVGMPNWVTSALSDLGCKGG
jgi:hypothetical protein